MKNRQIWIVLFIIGLVMILNSEEWTRWLGREMSWNIAGTVLSVISGAGILLEMYSKSK